EPGFEAGGGEGVLDGMMVTASSFDGDEDIEDSVLGHRLADEGGRRFELDAVVRDLGRRDEDLAVEIGEHPFGACLGTVDADDAKMFGADLLDAWMDDTAWLVNKLGVARPGPLGGALGRHQDYLRKEPWGSQVSHGSPVIFSPKTTYQGTQLFCRPFSDGRV